MSRKRTSARAQATFNEIRNAHGAVPGIFRELARAPAALQALWGQMRALNQGTLVPREREAIALRVAQLTGNEYCLAFHTAQAVNAGVNYADIIDFRVGVSDRPREQTVLDLATALVSRREGDGKAGVTDARVRALNEEEIAEVVAHVAMSLSIAMYVSAVGVELRDPAATRVADEDAADARLQPPRVAAGALWQKGS